MNHRVILMLASKVNASIIPLILALKPNGFASEQKQHICFNTGWLNMFSVVACWFQKCYLGFNQFLLLNECNVEEM